MVICSDRDQKQRALLGFPACNSVRARNRRFARAVLLGKIPEALRFVCVPHDDAEPLRALVSFRKLPACKRPQRLIAAAIRVEADVIAHVDPAAGGRGKAVSARGDARLTDYVVSQRNFAARLIADNGRLQRAVRVHV